MTKVAIWIFHQIFEGFPNSTKKKNIWFLMVFPIVQICENTEKNYAIQKFFIKFLKVFTIVLHFLFFVFLMIFPIVLVHQIHQKKFENPYRWVDFFMKYHENEVWCCKLEQLFLNFWKISWNVTIEKNFKNIFSIFGWFPCSNPDQISSKISKSHFFLMDLMNDYYWENHQKYKKM